MASHLRCFSAMTLPRSSKAAPQNTCGTTDSGWGSSWGAGATFIYMRVHQVVSQRQCHTSSLRHAGSQSSQQSWNNSSNRFLLLHSSAASCRAFQLMLWPPPCPACLCSGCPWPAPLLCPPAARTPPHIPHMLAGAYTLVTFDSRSRGSGTTLHGAQVSVMLRLERSSITRSRAIARWSAKTHFQASSQ